MFKGTPFLFLQNNTFFKLFKQNKIIPQKIIKIKFLVNKVNFSKENSFKKFIINNIKPFPKNFSIQEESIKKNKSFPIHKVCCITNFLETGVKKNIFLTHEKFKLENIIRFLNLF